MQPNPANWVDLRAVKQSISLEAILSSRYGLQLRKIGRTLRGRCPLPTHDPQKIAHSFMVNTVKNVWACHSASCQEGRGGKVGGNALDFVMLMERCSIAEAGRRLREWSGTGHVSEENLRASKESSSNGELSERNAPLEFELRGINPSHSYLIARGVKTETAAAFGIGHYAERGIMKGRVVIPVHNSAGELVAYAGRAIDGTEPRYRFPRGFLKSEELFNLHRVTATRVREIILVEGFFDCVNLHQAGIKNVAALMGSTLSRAQQGLLTRYFDRVILMLDGDKPGREASRKIAERLHPHLSVEIVEVPGGKQPDQLGASELRQLLGLGARGTGRARQTLSKPAPMATPSALAKTARDY